MAYSDSYGDTPLMLAAESQTSTELVKVLLDAGAETNPTDEQVCIVANSYAQVANQLSNISYGTGCCQVYSKINNIIVIIFV